MKIFRIYSRLITRNKIFSIISIGGFSLSLAVVILLLSFIRSEMQYDRDIPDLDQVYRIYRVSNSEKNAAIPEQIRERLEAEFPQVIVSTKVTANYDPVLWNEKNTQVPVVHTDESFFEVFGVEFVVGQSDGLFEDPHQAVITESYARLIFGEEDPIGQILNVSHREDVQVVAVVKDLPKKSSLSGGLFCSSELRIRYSSYGHNETTVYMYKNYLKLHTDTETENLEIEMTSAFQQYMDWMENEYHLQPFKEVYFDASMWNDNLSHANVKLIRLLSWLALVILFLAVFNYINLTIAQSTGRLHEYGVKQVFGAERKHLIRQFISEALFQVFLALIISLLLTFLLKPTLSEILGKEIMVSQILTDPVSIMIILAGLIVIAIISGFYPAYAVIRFQPRLMLIKQAARLRESFDIRRLLTVIQFTATVTLIICLITLVKQVRFVQNKDLGYNTELLVRIGVHYKIKDNVTALLSEISGLASVKSVCATHGTPGAVYSNSSNNEVAASHIRSDYRFIETFQLEILYGRNFFEGEEKEVCLLNKTMMEELGGWDSIENRTFFGSEVVGVVEDFHFKNLYTPVENLQIRNELDVSHLNIRFYPGDISDNLEAVEKIFKEQAPGFVFSYEFYDDWLESQYRQEEKRAQSIRLLSLIAILLSCMGLFGMAEFSTRNRTREIGIRKVNGAETTRILWLLNLDFLKWVVVGLILGMPLGWYFMNRWLAGFAYRTSLDWWIFVFAGTASIIVAILTISWQTWKAARKNPVESLRYE
ncbi:ABC transporter permease [Bacteroidota bacterium]